MAMQMVPHDRRLFLHGALFFTLQEPESGRLPQLREGLTIFAEGQRTGITHAEFWALFGLEAASISAISHASKVEFPREAHEGHHPAPRNEHTLEEEHLNKFVDELVENFTMEGVETKKLSDGKITRITIRKLSCKFSVAMFYSLYGEECKTRKHHAFSEDAFRRRLHVRHPNLRLSAYEYGMCNVCLKHIITMNNAKRSHECLEAELADLKEEEARNEAAPFSFPPDNLQHVKDRIATLKKDCETNETERKASEKAQENHHLKASVARALYNKNRLMAHEAKQEWLANPDSERRTTLPRILSISIDAAAALLLPLMRNQIPTQFGWSPVLSMPMLTVVDEGGAHILAHQHGEREQQPAAVAPLVQQQAEQQPEAARDGAAAQSASGHDQAGKSRCNFFVQNEAAGSMNADAVIAALLWYLYSTFGDALEQSGGKHLIINVDNCCGQVFSIPPSCFSVTLDPTFCILFSFSFLFFPTSLSLSLSARICFSPHLAFFLCFLWRSLLLHAALRQFIRIPSTPPCRYLFSFSLLFSPSVFLFTCAKCVLVLRVFLLWLALLFSSDNSAANFFRPRISFSSALLLGVDDSLFICYMFSPTMCTFSAGVKRRFVLTFSCHFFALSLLFLFFCGFFGESSTLSLLPFRSPLFLLRLCLCLVFVSEILTPSRVVRTRIASSSTSAPSWLPVICSKPSTSTSWLLVTRTFCATPPMVCFEGPSNPQFSTFGRQTSLSLSATTSIHRGKKGGSQTR